MVKEECLSHIFCPLLTVLALGSIVFLTGRGTLEQLGGKSAMIHYDNSFFYGEDGTFQEERAKAAYVSMMEAHGYSLTKGMKEKLWVSDYGTGQFAHLGLGAYCFVNNEEDRYMLMDMYLLPNQMMPEHWHIKTEKNPAKLEGWLVRHGQAYIVGEGQANLPEDVVVPQCHMDGKVTTEHQVLANAGDWVQLNRAGARHWQFGGPDGAIVNEVANVHSGDGVRHSDKGINDHFLAGQ